MTTARCQKARRAERLVELSILTGSSTRKPPCSKTGDLASKSSVAHDRCSSPIMRVRRSRHRLRAIRQIDRFYLDEFLVAPLIHHDVPSNVSGDAPVQEGRRGQHKRHAQGTGLLPAQDGRACAVASRRRGDHDQQRRGLAATTHHPLRGFPAPQVSGRRTTWDRCVRRLVAASRRESVPSMECEILLGLGRCLRSRPKQVCGRDPGRSPPVA
jgi:hypothetical protein